MTLTPAPRESVLRREIDSIKELHELEPDMKCKSLDWVKPMVYIQKC